MTCSRSYILLSTGIALCLELLLCPRLLLPFQYLMQATRRKEAEKGPFFMLRFLAYLLYSTGILGQGQDYEKTNVRDREAVLEIKEYILKMYSGIKRPAEVTSFVLDGEYRGCIPFKEQPTVHLLGIKEFPELLRSSPSGYFPAAAQCPKNNIIELPAFASPAPNLSTQMRGIGFDIITQHVIRCPGRY